MKITQINLIQTTEETDGLSKFAEDEVNKFRTFLLSNLKNQTK